MDTLKCLQKMKEKKISTLSIINVIGSSIARESDYILPTLAGPEIGVASTKAFTSQLIVLALLSLHFFLCLQSDCRCAYTVLQWLHLFVCFIFSSFLFNSLH